MKIIITGKGTPVALDPADKYDDTNYLIEAMGPLPLWIDLTDDTPFTEQLEAHYGFPVSWTMGGTITDEGIYQHPEDPDLYPLGAIQREYEPKQLETVYFYEYGIVGVVRGGKQNIGRMD